VNLEQLRSIVLKISYRDWTFEVLPVGAVVDSNGFFLRACFWEVDVSTGHRELQKGRKWFISTHATESEFVQTGLLAVLVATEHEVRESFRFNYTQVFGPHQNVHELVLAMQSGTIGKDIRPNPSEAIA
jgi:hypothetical protein